MNRQYNGFRAQNDSMVNWACQLTDTDLEQYSYRLSDPAKEVPLMDFSTSDKATRPIMNWSEKKLLGKAREDIK